MATVGHLPTRLPHAVYARRSAAMSNTTHRVVDLRAELRRLVKTSKAIALHRLVQLLLEAILCGPGRACLHVTLLPLIVQPDSQQLLLFRITEHKKDAGGLVNGAAGYQGLVVDTRFDLDQ